MNKLVSLFRTTFVQYSLKYHFCQTNQLRNLFHSYKHQADSTQITSQITQLNFEQLTINQQKVVAKIFFETADYQEEIAAKIFDTAVSAYFAEKSSLNDTLDILSTITSPVNSEQFNDNLMKFLVTVVRLPYLEAEQFAYAMIIYGKLLKIQFEKNGMLEFEFVRHAEYVNKFTSKSLSTLAQGVMLSSFKEKAILKLLDTHSQNTEMDLVDLIRVASTLLKFNGGSEEFWLYFSNELKSKASEIKPTQIILLLMIAKNGEFDSKSVLQTLEFAFLKLYNDIPFEERALAFSELASISYKSVDLWKKFESDYYEIVKKQKVSQSVELIYECLNIFEIFSEEIQQKMLIFIIENSQHIEIEFKDVILRRAVEKGIITKEEAGL